MCVLAHVCDSSISAPDEETDMCVRDQALLYYRLLCRGVDSTRSVLQGRRSDPSLGLLIGCPAEPISQWAGTFNTLRPLMQGAAETASPSRGQCHDAELPASLTCGPADAVLPGKPVSWFTQRKNRVE